MNLLRRSQLSERMISPDSDSLQAELVRLRQENLELTQLLEQMTQEKNDLEMILDTIREHDDAIGDHMLAEIDNAVNLANIDGLTKISNRRKFDEFLEISWMDQIAAPAPLSVLLCDIDYFKRYNDHYGHIEGDKCLIKVAQAMNLTIRRAKDLVARYGGEEFGLILPQTSLRGAITVAQRLRETINGLNIPHAKSDTASHITLSIGIAHMIPVVHHSAQTLLELADQQLYKAKIRGRNQLAYIDLDEK